MILFIASPPLCHEAICFFHSARAHRTARPLRAGAGIDGRAPHMSHRALPPHPSPAPTGHILRRQSSVERRMPLRGDVRIQRCQIVISLQHRLSSTNRASALVDSGSGLHDCLPFVTAGFASPPCFAVGICSDVRWGHVRVFRRMPLGGNGRKQGCEVVFAGDNRQSRADRTAGVTAGAGTDLRPPRVTTLTAPRDLLLTAVGNGLRRYGKIRRFVPLVKQLCSVVFDAVVV